MQQTVDIKNSKEKYVNMKEMIIFFMGTFFLTTMQGMTGNYRQAYFVNVLQLPSDNVALINSFCSVANFALGFFITMMIDRTPKAGKNKFKPLVSLWTIPMGIMVVLMFYTPSFMSKNITILVIYCIAINLIYNIAQSFAGTLNNIAVVMSPNNNERDTLLTWRGIVNAIGNSAPLVVILVAGMITKDEGLQYLSGAIVCSLIGVIIVLSANSVIKERIAYNDKKSNPLLGYVDVLKNKYAWIIIISEFLKNFRGVTTYMGIFLAAALLGSTSKYILLGLPTGIGTFVGMLIVKALMKKFSTKQIYIASGFYSVIANGIAFAFGVAYFKTGSTALQIAFVGSLFLIGLQFGASNLIPSMFQADILEDLEVKTHKRLDASLGFVCGIGAMISGTIAAAIAPLVLYGSNSIIQYVQPINNVYQEQELRTKILLLLFYTIGHGLMMLLAGLPFFFYHLTGKTKDEIHNSALAYREQLEKEKE